MQKLVVIERKLDDNVKGVAIYFKGSVIVVVNKNICCKEHIIDILYKKVSVTKKISKL